MTTSSQEVRACAAAECYLCGNQGRVLHSPLRDVLFGAPGTWALQRCPSCGLVWLDPRPQPDDIPKLYSDYPTHGEPERQTASISYGVLPVLRDIKRAILSTTFGYDTGSGGFLQAIGRVCSRIGPLRDRAGRFVYWLDARPQGRLLDVGCGNGRFLSQMRSLGWTVQGVEPDPLARRQAVETLGLDVPFATVEEARFPDESFDAVVFAHVVEHLSDPIRTLTECRRILKKRGKLILITPNVDGLGSRWFRESWRGLEVPRHLFLFSPETLRACAEKTGLRVTEVSTSADSAAFIWLASLAIQRQRSSGGLTNHSLLSATMSYLFWALEAALLQASPVGEEIRLTATKD